jgi:TorA maturation chaperone TorD
MASSEKEQFCGLMAGLFSPPKREIVDEIRKEGVFSFLANAVKSWVGDSALLDGLQVSGPQEVFHAELQEEYHRLFSGGEKESISLIESPHKPWTQDPECRLSFAREKGFLKGDAALHMEAIFQKLCIEVPEPFRDCPDHLVVELEFLSALYGKATDREVKQFIQDHLDWIPQLKKEMMELRSHSFYLSAIELLDLFLTREKDRLEKIDYGETSFH